MEFNISKAVDLFFSKPSLETVYFEAIANSIDAGATEIMLSLSLESLKNPNTFQLIISDNGEGFTDRNFEKFSKLLETEEKSHRGIGRLVFLGYFDTVEIKSIYNGHCREFIFRDPFDGSSDLKPVDADENETILTFKGYTKERIYEYAYVLPSELKKAVIKNFFPLLYSYKVEGKKLKISFNLSVTEDNIDQGFYDRSESFTLDDLPDLETEEISKQNIDLFSTISLNYSLERGHSDPLRITSICSDGRTYDLVILSKDALPKDTQAIFIIMSDYFTGRTNIERTSLDIDEATKRKLKTIVEDKMSEIILRNIPSVRESNQKKYEALVNRYPHLQGYFDKGSLGLIDPSKTLEKAQNKFFTAQKEILEAGSLSDEQYKKSIEISARALTEYILFRQITIDKLKNTTNINSEAELHKLFATMKVQFDKENINYDIYRNNAWLLDDKYMTYEVVLSDKEMGKLVNIISEDENERDGDRPDIALVFSNNPNKGNPFDVVIVELKKRGLTLEENMKVITQLEKRARKLMKYYKNRIQRIWYYGIIEFNDDVELALTGEYKELYSSGKMYYRETKVAIAKDPEIIIPIGVFIWDIDAVVADADARNSTFLNLIKSNLQKMNQ